jgi:hypothetical protein
MEESMRTFALVGAAALLGLVGARAYSQAVAGKDDRIALLINQLGDEKFTRREAATKALAKIGEPGLVALRKAAASHDDIEVRARAGRLVETIENDLPLFNGKDLTGWRGLTDCWRVTDGMLIGTTEPGGVNHNTFLCSKRAFKDFELKFKVQLVGTGWVGNSGVQIRSEVVDEGKCIVKGPQCDIGAGYWGDLHGELAGGLMKQAPQEVVAKIVKEGEFNDYFIRCVGRHVTIKLNGVTTIDADFADLPETGIIAWQLHNGGPMTVTFKDIEFKDLSRK